MTAQPSPVFVVCMMQGMLIDAANELGLSDSSLAASPNFVKSFGQDIPVVLIGDQAQRTPSHLHPGYAASELAHDRGGHLPQVLKYVQVHTMSHPQSLRANPSRDHRQSSREGLENLEPGAAADP